MTKKELLNKLDSLLDAKGMYKIETIDGKIDMNNCKTEIEWAIKCLEASDNKMWECMAIMQKEYPSMCDRILNNGDWLTHSFNRYWVFSTAKALSACGKA